MERSEVGPRKHPVHLHSRGAPTPPPGSGLFLQPQLLDQGGGLCLHREDQEHALHPAVRQGGHCDFYYYQACYQGFASLACRCTLFSTVKLRIHVGLQVVVTCSCGQAMQSVSHQ